MQELTFRAESEARAGDDRRLLAFGVAAVAVSFVIYALASLKFDAGRPDFFYLADAFLHGRFWLDHPFGPWDNVLVGDRVYVPFAPFPALAELPLVAIFGPARLDQWEQVVDSAFAAIDVGLCWWLMARVGVRTVVERIWIVFLFGFSTQILWVTTRGGVWHTGHLIAAMVTLAALVETFGRRRSWVLGLLLGAAFLTRAPLGLAVLFFGWAIADGRGSEWLHPRGWPWREWAIYGIAIVPSVAFAFWYNDVRFGSPLESGYGLATLPPFLERLREQGLFSLNHLGMNLDYLLTHLPTFFTRQPDGSLRLEIPPRPDGLGMSILLTSPGLLLALLRRLALADDDRPGADGARRPGAEPALLRRRLAPVRLSLRAGLDPVRHGPRGTCSGSSRPPGLGQGAHRVRHRRQPPGRLLGLQPLMTSRHPTSHDP